MKKPFLRAISFALFGLMISAPALAEVTGTFKGNGKDAKLAFARAMKGEPFSGEETVVVLLTEKDTSAEKKPEMKVAFGDYGSALIVKITKSGNIYGTDVSHSAHTKRPFSSIGTLKIEGFKWDASGVSGKLSTGGQDKFFDETWEVDLTFKAPVQ